MNPKKSTAQTVLTTYICWITIGINDVIQSTEAKISADFSEIYVCKIEKKYRLLRA